MGAGQDDQLNGMWRNQNSGGTTDTPPQETTGGPADTGGMTREQAQQKLRDLEAQLKAHMKMQGHPSHYYKDWKGKPHLNNAGKAWHRRKNELNEQVNQARQYITDNNARWNQEDRNELGPTDTSDPFAAIRRLQEDPEVQRIMNEQGIPIYSPPSIIDSEGNLLEGYGKEERDAGIWSEARRLQQQGLNRAAGKSVSDANRLAQGQMENVAMRGGLRTGARGRIAQSGLRAGLAAQQATLGKRLGLDIADETARQKDLEFNIGARKGAFDKASDQYDNIYNRYLDAITGKKASEEI